MGCSPWGCKTAQVIAERTDSVCQPTQKPGSASRRTDEHTHGCTRDTRTLAARARDLCAHTQGPATEGQSAPPRRPHTPTSSAKPRAAAWQDTCGSRHAATCREQPASSLPSPRQNTCRPTCALMLTGACRPQEAETGRWHLIPKEQATTHPPLKRNAFVGEVPGHPPTLCLPGLDAPDTCPEQLTPPRPGGPAPSAGLTCSFLAIATTSWSGGLYL